MSAKKAVTIRINDKICFGNNAANYQNLAFRIAYYRNKRGLTQEQLAEQAGISRQHLGSIEAPNMYREISMDVLFNIATALEVEPYKLLK